MSIEYAPSPWTYREHQGQEPPGLLEASRLSGNFFDAEGNRIGLFGSAACRLIEAAPYLLMRLRHDMDDHRAVALRNGFEECLCLRCIEDRGRIARIEGVPDEN